MLGTGRCSLPSKTPKRQEPAETELKHQPAQAVARERGYDLPHTAAVFAVCYSKLHALVLTSIVSLTRSVDRRNGISMPVKNVVSLPQTGYSGQPDGYPPHREVCHVRAAVTEVRCGPLFTQLSFLEGPMAIFGRLLRPSYRSRLRSRQQRTNSSAPTNKDRRRWGEPTTERILIGYPISALQKAIQGLVIVRFTVEPSGRASSIEIVKGLDPACDEEVVEAVERARFMPGKRKGRDVPAYSQMTVRFVLAEAESRNAY